MLPVIYEALIDDENLGMFALALVKNPATQTSWMTFAGQEQKVMCSVVDEEEHKILCVIMRADFPIYRRGLNNEEFYVVYHADTLKKMAQKLLKDGKQGVINLEHMKDSEIVGVEMEQIFIKDSSKGISPVGFEDIEEGSLFGIYHVTSPEVWEAIKSGVFTSVSLEGMFNLVPERKKEETISTLKELFDYLKK